MVKCIFCKIANGEAQGAVLYEGDKVIAFKDIKPVAPVHAVIIPKKHILAADQLGLENKELIGDLFLAAQIIAREQGIAETGYRLIFNIGKDAGQTVEHLHLHLIGGEKLPFT